MGCCTSDQKMDDSEFDVTSKRIDKGMKISDIDAWSHVTDLWNKHGLKKEEALKFEKAKSFIE